jgi:hypothetical protein
MGPMMVWFATTTLLAFLLMVSSAQAGDETTIINLSCEGTAVGYVDEKLVEKPGPAIAFLVVDLSEHTVTGLGIVAHIRNATNFRISFHSKINNQSGEIASMAGHINRQTGKAFINTALKVMIGDKEVIRKEVYELICEVRKGVL